MHQAVYSPLPPPPFSDDLIHGINEIAHMQQREEIFSIKLKFIIIVDYTPWIKRIMSSLAKTIGGIYIFTCLLHNIITYMSLKNKQHN